MGAWGLGLFESDHDYDLVSDMDHEAGLRALEDEAKKKTKQHNPHSSKEGDENTAKSGNSTSENKATETQEDHGDFPTLSVYAGMCADVALVREHLDSGVLLKLINEKKTKMDAATEPYDLSWAVYDLVLLGACAMSLGCKIPGDFKALLIKHYRSTDLQRDALMQMQVALGDSPKRYKEGEPYDFGSRGVEETANDQNKDDHLFPNGKGFQLINVAAPFGMMRNPNQAPPKEFAANVCGGCGAKERGDGDPLLSCGKCKTRRYCGKVCQQAHYKRHKPLCKTPEGA